MESTAVREALTSAIRFWEPRRLIYNVFVQASAFRDEWRRRRWVLFVIGTVVAAVLARFVAMGPFHLA